MFLSLFFLLPPTLSSFLPFGAKRAEPGAKEPELFSARFEPDFLRAISDFFPEDLAESMWYKYYDDAS